MNVMILHTNRQKNCLCQNVTDGWKGQTEHICISNSDKKSCIANAKKKTIKNDKLAEIHVYTENTTLPRKNIINKSYLL